MPITYSARKALRHKAFSSPFPGTKLLYIPSQPIAFTPTPTLQGLDLARAIGHRDPRSLMFYYAESAEDLAKKLGQAGYYTPALVPPCRAFTTFQQRQQIERLVRRFQAEGWIKKRFRWTGAPVLFN